MKSRYFIILAVIAALFGLYQLSANARAVVKLRDQIIAKDQAGADVKSDLDNLETFAHAHPNASVSFELTGSYERAVAATQPPAPSGALYAQAQTACAGRADSIVQARCVTDYVSKRLPPPPAPVAPPDRSLYLKQFHAPAWAPDLAGLSLLVAVVLALTALGLRLFRPKAYLQ